MIIVQEFAHLGRSDVVAILPWALDQSKQEFLIVEVVALVTVVLVLLP